MHHNKLFRVGDVEADWLADEEAGCKLGAIEGRGCKLGARVVAGIIGEKVGFDGEACFVLSIFFAKIKSINPAIRIKAKRKI